MIYIEIKQILHVDLNISLYSTGLEYDLFTLAFEKYHEIKF